jgi:hypothetical protein
MKKTLSIVLALALALSMVASMAFVLGPSTGVTGATNSALNITAFYTTYDASNLVAGTRLYSEIVDKTDSAFAKNELIQFCVKFDVLNAKTVANGVASDKANGTSTLVFTSDTVNLSVNQYPGQMALYEDAGMELVNAVKVSTNLSGQGGVYNAKANSLTVEVDFSQAETGRINGFDAEGIAIAAPASYKEAKASYALIFSGITKGEITEKGAVQMQTAYDSGVSFNKDGVAYVVRNGRHYQIKKVAAKWTATTTSVPSYAALSTIGYEVTLGTAQTDGSYKYDLPVAQFDTEVVVYQNIDSEVNGTDIEGIGSSLGLVEDGVKVFKTVLNDGTTVYLRENGSKAFVEGTDSSRLTRFQTAMDDFGFKTDVGYTYKLTDDLFTTAGSYSIVREATYNNGTVVAVEPAEDEEADVDEGTDEEEVTEDEEEVVEEDEEVVEDDEEVDETEEDVEDDAAEEEEVAPTTGDVASNVAIALAAAAIVAAAALAVVMKKARD